MDSRFHRGWCLFQKVLVVCVGNICRSPMAALLLRARVPGLEVSSAGLAAQPGRPADPMAVELLAERGLDLSGHRARQIEPSLVEAADLVLVMEREQVAALDRLTPAARGRIQPLGRFGNFDVPDPFRKPRPAFEEALALIDRGLQEYAQRFWSRS
jgi:protein-tyrosine phosphatase